MKVVTFLTMPVEHGSLDTARQVEHVQVQLPPTVPLHTERMSHWWLTRRLPLNLHAGCICASLCCRCRCFCCSFIYLLARLTAEWDPGGQAVREAFLAQDALKAVVTLVAEPLGRHPDMSERVRAT